MLCQPLGRLLKKQRLRVCHVLCWGPLEKVLQFAVINDYVVLIYWSFSFNRPVDDRSRQHHQCRWLARSSLGVVFSYFKANDNMNWPVTIWVVKKMLGMASQITVWHSDTTSTIPVTLIYYSHTCGCCCWWRMFPDMPLVVSSNCATAPWLSKVP